MIRVGIIGCGNPRADELLRVLINHPDVDLKWVQDAARAGERVDRVVRGVVGECDLVVSAPRDVDDVDVVFLCGSRDKVSSWLGSTTVPDDVRVIDLSGLHNLNHSAEGPWVYGLSEMQRRVLVHDAHLVTVPGSLASAALLALMPMARNLLLNSPLELYLAIDENAFADDRTVMDGIPADAWIRNQQQEVVGALTQCQTGFNQPVKMTVSRMAESRILSVAACFNSSVDEDKVRQLYEQYYDDHNFVFIVDRPIVPADVRNTNKCLIRLDKNDRTGQLTVHAVMDLLLKGSSGTAVHMMNLLFGLHERVGLSLKATGC